MENKINEKVPHLGTVMHMTTNIVEKLLHNNYCVLCTIFSILLSHVTDYYFHSKYISGNSDVFLNSGQSPVPCFLFSRKKISLKE